MSQSSKIADETPPEPTVMFQVSTELEHREVSKPGDVEISWRPSFNVLINPLLLFFAQPFASSVHVAFWQELGRLKVDVLGLDQRPLV